MGGGVDAARQAARHHDAAPGELGTEPLADLPGVVSRGPGPYHSHRRSCEHGCIAANPQDRRRIRNASQQDRIALVEAGDRIDAQPSRLGEHRAGGFAGGRSVAVRQAAATSQRAKMGVTRHVEGSRQRSGRCGGVTWVDRTCGLDRYAASHKNLVRAAA